MLGGLAGLLILCFCICLLVSHTRHLIGWILSFSSFFTGHWTGTVTFYEGLKKKHKYERKTPIVKESLSKIVRHLTLFHIPKSNHFPTCVTCHTSHLMGYFVVFGMDAISHK